MTGAAKSYKDVTFALLTVGLPLVETKINDTLKVATNSYVIGISAFLGFSLGSIVSLMLYQVEELWYLPSIYFTIAPPLINIFANYVALTYIVLNLKFRKSAPRDDAFIVSSSFFNIFISCMLFWIIYLYIRNFFGAGGELNYIFIFIVPALYAAISEVVHYVIYRYMIHEFDQDQLTSYGAMDRSRAAYTQPESPPETSPVKAPRRLVAIGLQMFDADEIILLEAQGNYLRILTSEGEFNERCQMSSACENLDDSLGVQVHRSFWVSFSAIDALVRADGTLSLRLTNGEEVKIARPRQREVRSTLEAKGIGLSTASASELGETER